MKREFNVEANVGRPQVSYRETIRGDGREGRGQASSARPAARASTASSTSTSSRRPARASTSSTRSRAARSRPSSSPPSRRASRRRWRPASRPATRWSTSASRSSTASTTTPTPRRSPSRSPARSPSRRPPRRAKPVLLEPIFAVEVVTPEEFLGDVIGDLSRRRGRVEGQERRGNALVVTAYVPLSEMFGYATDLRSNTQGRATYTMQFEQLRRGSAEHRREDRRGPQRRAAPA